jgi:hypothetical protein
MSVFLEPEAQQFTIEQVHQDFCEPKALRIRVRTGLKAEPAKTSSLPPSFQSVNQTVNQLVDQILQIFADTFPCAPSRGVKTTSVKLPLNSSANFK